MLRRMKDYHRYLGCSVMVVSVESHAYYSRPLTTITNEIRGSVYIPLICQGKALTCE